MILYSTEAVTKYHPDKYADQISDAIVTACMREDRDSRCGVEAMVKGKTVVLGGEVTTKANIDYEAIVRRVAAKLHYEVDSVINLISEQSSEIHAAVDKNNGDIGAGDQGIVFGYASALSPSKLHPAFDIANRIVATIEKDVEENPDTILKGDAKTQVVYDCQTLKIKTIYVSACHKEDVPLYKLRPYLFKLLGWIAQPESWSFNPAGTWTVGGPEADCGLTGRKIVCDQTGGTFGIGGGAFSGKDVSKVDRTGTYMAMHIARDLIDKFHLANARVQLGFMIGKTKPVSILAMGNDLIDYSQYVLDHYDLSVKGMIEALDLYNCDFEKIAEGCHFFDKETFEPRF